MFTDSVTKRSADLALRHQRAFVDEIHGGASIDSKAFLKQRRLWMVFRTTDASKIDPTNTSTLSEPEETLCEACATNLEASDSYCARS
jgi:hypothetical protein